MACGPSSGAAGCCAAVTLIERTTLLDPIVVPAGSFINLGIWDTLNLRELALSPRTADSAATSGTSFTWKIQGWILIGEVLTPSMPLRLTFSEAARNQSLLATSGFYLDSRKDGGPCTTTFDYHPKGAVVLLRLQNDGASDASVWAYIVAQGTG